MTPTAASIEPTPDWPGRVALFLLQAGAIAVVLAAAPYKIFDLDRFFVPKELALDITALLVTLICIARARRVTLARVDQWLALWLILGVASALFATNWWLAGRAVAISAGGAACFWCARSLARAGYSRALVSALALAGVIGAITALLQTYGVRTDFVSLNRAPGGTFGNRNFMAHLCVITMPALIFSGIRAPSTGAFMRWCVGMGLVISALVLSRTRAAWLAMCIGLAVLAITGLIAARGNDKALRLSRVFLLLIIGAVAAGAALVIPNTLDWKSDSPYLDTASSMVNYKGGSGHGRLVQYGNSMRMSLRHPFLGVGPGNWPVIYPQFASEGDPSMGQDGTTSNPWPSSDVVTFVSERGVLAFATLALALLALIGDGVRELWNGATTEDRLSAAVLLATIVVLVTVGSFDAVLLLPVGALIGWALLGALSLPGVERSSVALTVPRRAGMLAIVALLGVLATARSGSQLAAMELYSTNSRTVTLERASALDPGSYRIHVRLAQLYLGRGDCTHARAHANAARKLFPSAPAPKHILASCGR